MFIFYKFVLRKFLNDFSDWSVRDSRISGFISFEMLSFIIFSNNCFWSFYPSSFSEVSILVLLLVKLLLYPLDLIASVLGFPFICLLGTALWNYRCFSSDHSLFSDFILFSHLLLYPWLCYSLNSKPLLCLSISKSLLKFLISFPWIKWVEPFLSIFRTLLQELLWIPKFVNARISYIKLHNICI